MSGFLRLFLKIMIILIICDHQRPINTDEFAVSALVCPVGPLALMRLGVTGRLSNGRSQPLWLIALLTRPLFPCVCLSSVCYDRSLSSSLRASRQSVTVARLRNSNSDLDEKEKIRDFLWIKKEDIISKEGRKIRLCQIERWMDYVDVSVPCVTRQSLRKIAHPADASCVDQTLSRAL